MLNAITEDVTITPAEEQANDAYAIYAAETRRLVTMQRCESFTPVERATQAHRVLAAEGRWKLAARIWEAACAPTPAAAIPERNSLACEGVLLLCAMLVAFGILLPIAIEGDGPLLWLSTNLGCVGVGAWALHFGLRAGKHLGGRTRV